MSGASWGDVLDAIRDYRELTCAGCFPGLGSAIAARKKLKTEIEERI